MRLSLQFASVAVRPSTFDHLGSARAELRSAHDSLFSYHVSCAHDMYLYKRADTPLNPTSSYTPNRPTLLACLAQSPLFRLSLF